MESLNEASAIIDNEINKLRALEKVRDILGLAARVEEGLSEQRRALADLQVAKKTLEAQVASARVDEQAAIQKMRAAQDESERVRAVLAKEIEREREADRAEVAALKAEFQALRQKLTAEHNAAAEGYRREIETLEQRRATVTRDLEQLRQKFG